LPSNIACSAIRPQLGLPMGSANPEMADCHYGRHLLCWSLGCYAVDLAALQQDAYLASTRFRRRPRSPKMVPGKCHFNQTNDSVIKVVADAVGDIFPCIVYSLGRLCRTLSRYFSVALAGRSRRNPRRRTGHDSSSSKGMFIPLPIPSTH
jgi:hypothetical protein